MPAILQMYAAALGANSGAPGTYYFMQAPLSYAGTLDTVTGISAASDAEKDMPQYKVEALLAKGILFRVVVNYEVAGKRKSSRILVTRDKLGTALDGLIGKSFRQGEIKSARIPRKATFY